MFADSGNLALHIGPKSHKSTWHERGTAPPDRRRSGDCAPHCDPLGCPDGRAGLVVRFESRRPVAPPPTRFTEPRHQMDFLKPRYTPMSRRRRIYEGKAKVLYEGPEPGTLIQHFKDDATAFNAKKHEVIDGKGVLNNRISEYVFQHLNDIGVPTHFIRRLNMREQLIREVEIIPLEVVVRNVAAGSLSTAPRHRGRHAAAALDHRVLLQERRAQRSDGVGGAHHRLRLGDAAGDRRHHGARHPRQRLPLRPVPRRRHPARRLQDGDAAGCGKTT